MVKYKLVIGEKSGKTKQIELEEAPSKALNGLKISETFKGETIDMPGYEFLVTGGSDSAGFPMRHDVNLAGKKKILLVSDIGIKKNVAGRRVRKTVAGNTVGPNTAQINLKVTKAGKKPLFEEAAAAPKAE